MNPPRCPERGQLQKLLADHLSPDEELRLVRHLDECTACQQMLDTLVGQSDLLQDVQQRPGHGGERDPSDMVSAVSPGQTELDFDSGQTRIENSGPTGRFSAQVESDESRLAPIEDIDLVAELGRGSMGVVYKGYEHSLKRTVAVKILARRLAASGEACERFLREAQSLAAVRHRHIVSIFRIVHPDSDAGGGVLPCLVMEFVDGISLEQQIRHAGSLPLRDVVRTGIGIASALAAAHEHDIIHRDIKPANILLEGATGLVKITDFGLARAVDDVTLTQSGALVGTPAYMSPEQAEGLRVDSRSDLFSLGSVLYMMLAGRPPFGNSPTMKTLGNVLQSRAIPVESLRRDTPVWLSDIVAQLHANHPADRIQTAEEVIQLLLEGRSLITAQSHPDADVPPEPTTVVPNQDTTFLLPLPDGWLRICGLAMVCVSVLGLALAGVTGFPVPEPEPDSTVSLSVQPEPTDLQLDYSKEPFVVLVNGEPEPKLYESLGEAIRSAPNGAVIELRMDGPLITPCLVIRQDRLTIRAAPGFRPEIMPDRDLSGDAQALLTTSGQLRLEGLALSVRRHRVSGLQDRDLHVVLCRDGGLQMLNCRLERSGTSSCLKLDGVTSSRVENCELLSGNGAGIEWKPTRDASLIVRNSLFIGEAGCAVPHPAENTGFPRLQVLQCVLATRYGLELILPAGTSRETDSGGPVGVVCRYSVFAVGNSVLRIGLPEKEQLSGRPKNFENMAARIRAAIVWRDDRTLFGDQSQMQFFSCSGRSRLSDFPDELRDWCRFWGMKSFHRPVQNRIQFRSGESQTKRPPYPLRLAREYAVDQPLPVNAGREKFGIDPLIVGPGAGYVQWISRLE